MASTSEIKLVRLNTNESSAQTGGKYSDTKLAEYIDEFGVAGATAVIWEEKAARFSELVDVTEAGASHKFSDLHKTAASQALYWRKRESSIADESLTVSRPKVHKIVRS